MVARAREAASFCKAEKFAIHSRAVETEANLRRLLDDICDDIGFRYYALVHHVDFTRPASDPILLHNYPEEWVDYFVRHKLFARDPVHRASATTSLGFAWGSVPRMIKLTTEDADVLRSARLAGIGDGFTVPAHVPGEANGSCSFATAAEREMHEALMPMAQIIGAFAFEAARRLKKRGTKDVAAYRPLTERQRQCVVLVAQGKTDWEISRILNVSHETVIQHLKHARERYGVTKRVSLTVRALYDGSVSFSEILDRHTHFLE